MLGSSPRSHTGSSMLQWQLDAHGCLPLIFFGSEGVAVLETGYSGSELTNAGKRR